MGSVIGVVSVITIILCLIGVVCYRKKMRTNAFLEATFGGMEESEVSDVSVTPEWCQYDVRWWLTLNVRGPSYLSLTRSPWEKKF